MLGLVELLLCLPMSNGKVERIFSTVKHVNSDRRCRLSEDRLDALVRIAVEGPPAADWQSGEAVSLWWSDKCRRTVRDNRAPAASARSQPEPSDDSDQYQLDLEDWDNFTQQA
eukprot:scpid90294/ scgid22121/ 